MGYGTREGGLGGKIRTYWPDDTDNTMYIDTSIPLSLAELMERAQEKWPGITPDQIKISSEEIQTDCLGYDAYDPMDYTDFIILEKI